MVRRYAALAIFVALALFGIVPDLLRMPMRRAAIAPVMLRAADREFGPAYPDFIRGVRDHTSSGDVIAIVVPWGWRQGYEYAFYRASYLLAGRTVVPILDREDRFQPENVADAQYLAVFRTPLPEGEVVWRNRDGVLVRRR